MRLVPNRVPAAIAVLGLACRALDGTVLMGLLAAIAVFFAAAMCWRRGWLGGADVKLLGAGALLVPPNAVIGFVLATCLAGGLLAGLYMALSRRAEPSEELTALIDGQVRLAIQQPGLVRVYESEERSLPDAPRKEIRRRQRAHVTRWIDVLAHFHPGQDRAYLEILAFGAIGLLLSAPRWPRTVRANPAFTRIISAAVWRCVGLHTPQSGPPWDDEAG